MAVTVLTADLELVADLSLSSTHLCNAAATADDEKSALAIACGGTTTPEAADGVLGE